ncbi:unnamed protein product [Polarella glacialis]|uniref:Uncharacterized protein n=1 Tax=Polarella glacialis TaxID=89957 RepID=A0A813DQE0_POLGL|nr:unnamed protein product [Polarella glacialis]
MILLTKLVLNNEDQARSDVISQLEPPDRIRIKEWQSGSGGTGGAAKNTMDEWASMEGVQGCAFMLLQQQTTTTATTTTTTNNNKQQQPKQQVGAPDVRRQYPRPLRKCCRTLAVEQRQASRSRYQCLCRKGQLGIPLQGRTELGGGCGVAAGARNTVDEWASVEGVQGCAFMLLACNDIKD